VCRLKVDIQIHWKVVHYTAVNVCMLSIVWSIIVNCICVKCNDHVRVNYRKVCRYKLTKLLPLPGVSLYWINFVLYFFIKVRKSSVGVEIRICRYNWMINSVADNLFLTKMSLYILRKIFSLWHRMCSK